MDGEYIQTNEQINTTKTNPQKIWSEYQKLVSYMEEKDVYNIVKKNEDFYDGRQWEGLPVSNTTYKATMNNLQRIGKYQISMLSSNDIGMSIKTMLGNDNSLDFITNEVKDVIEQAKIKETSRLAIRDAFVGGSAYMHQTFDPDFETGQESKGRIENELVDCRRMLFGNPYSADIQKQPYIIIVLRQYIDQVKEEARECGVSEDIIDEIKPDADENYDEDTGDKLVTVLVKYYKKKVKELFTKKVVDEFGNEIVITEEKEVKKVHFVKTTQNVVIKEETNLDYTRYPISRMGWDNRKDSFLFDTPLTWNIANQVFINKVYSYCHEYVAKSAYPKRIIDETKIDIEDWDSHNDIGVAGIDMMGKLFDISKMPDFSTQVLELIKLTEQEMEKNMGVNDAALGNIKPDNAKAILVTQDAATVPLEIQRQNSYEMWEDTIRNIIDIMIASYGIRQFVDEQGTIGTADYTQLKGLNYRLKIDISSSAQYSEIAQYETLTNLYQGGGIDVLTFLKAMPDKLIANREMLIKAVEENQAAQQQLMAQMPQQQ